MADYTAMSDSDLMALVQPKASSDYSKMSDAELLATVKPQETPRGVMDKLLGLSGPRYQTWPEKALRGMGSAATLPGDVMAGRAQVPQSENMPGGENTQELGRVTDLAGLVSPLAPKVVPSLGKAVLPTAEELKSAGGAGFDALRNLNVDIKPESVVNSFSGLRANLEKDGINAELAPKTFSILSRLGEAPADSVVTVGNLETVRRSLGNAAKDFTNPTEQLAASRAIQHLKSYLADIPAGDVLRGDASQIPKILGEATGNYAAGSRSEQVAEAVRSAELGAGAANSGKNIGNAERQKFKSLLLSDKQSSGFSPQELAQAERVVMGTTTGNTARHIANVLGGGGGMGQAVASGIAATGGAALGGVPGAAVGAAVPPVLGNMARILANKSVERQVNKLDDMVRARSPLAQSMPQGEGASRIPPAILARMLLESRQQQ